MDIKVNFDGACSENPGGSMGIGFIIRSDTLFSDGSDTIPASPENTCNIAEYLALCAAFERLLYHKLENEKIIVHGDSMLVINQMSGAWEAKSGAYLKYHYKAKELLKKFTNISFKWIPREKNIEADELSKKINLNV